jgi:hypothetical protein
MKEALVILAVTAPTSATVGSAACPPPVVQVWQNNQEVPSTGAAFASKVTLRVSPSPACTPGDSYRFREAEVTLIRGGRPLMMTRLVHTPKVNLDEFARSARPGDHIYVFVWYKNLYTVAANGTVHPYPRPELSEEQQRGITANLLTDEARGIGFNWVLQ